MATRNLSFVTTTSQGVSEDTTLILTFAPVDNGELYSTQFSDTSIPVVWKMLQFPANQTRTAMTTYTGRLGVAVADVVSGKVQNSQLNFVEMGLGQTTALSVVQAGSESWSEPQPKPVPGKGAITARNGTAQDQHLCLGLVNSPPGSPTIFDPVSVWTDVEPGKSMVASFSPKLQVYAARIMKNAIVTAEMITGLLGEWDLSQLSASPSLNTFHLYEDGSQGGALTLVRVTEVAGE